MNAVKAGDVKGLKVVTISNGAQVETVDDIVYDPASQKVTALIVSTGGLLGGKAKAIAIEEVKSIGKDAVIIDSAAAIKPVDQLSSDVEYIAKDDVNLVKSDIITTEGTQLGKVVDIMFDPSDGKVEELVVSQGGLKNMGSGKKTVKPEDIVTVGADATIVSNYTELAFEEQAEEGGVKGVLNNVTDKVGDAAATVTDKAQEAAETAKDKAGDLKDKTQEATAQAADKTQAKYDDIKNDPANQERLERAKQQIGDMKDQAQAKAADIRDTAQDKANDMRETAKDKASDVKDGAQNKVSQAASTPASGPVVQKEITVEEKTSTEVYQKPQP